MTASSSSRISAVHPLWAVEGGRVTIAGSDFVVDPVLPRVLIGGLPARLSSASATELNAIVPAGLDGGHTPVRVEDAPGETAFVEIGAPLATGLHQVDSPAFDADGNLYVTFSGSRGQQGPGRHLHRPPRRIARAVRVRSGESDVTGVRSRGTPARVEPFRRQRASHRSRRRVRQSSRRSSASPAASRFRLTARLFVGDRSGTIFRVREGRPSAFASIPPSVAAFHLAFGPDGWLYVTAPTLGARDSVYRVSPGGDVEVFFSGFGRPAGTRLRLPRRSLRRRRPRRCERRLPTAVSIVPTDAGAARRRRLARRAGVRSARRVRAGIERHGVPPAGSHRSRTLGSGSGAPSVLDSLPSPQIRFSVPTNHQ